MRIITRCQVEVVGASEFRPHPTYKLPPLYHPREALIATAGKVCYDSYGVEGHPVNQHVENLVMQGHLSVLEHVSVSLFIEGISRGCSHEIVRHRHFSYSQRSTRYTAEEDAAIVLEPFMADIHERVNRGADVPQAEVDLLVEYIAGAEASVYSYRNVVQQLLDLAPDYLSNARERRKWARGKARQRLPHDLETRMVMTGNMRSWREFLIKRSNEHAEAEIRRLANAVADRVIDIAPAAFADLKTTMVNGFYEFTSTTGV